VIFIEHEYLYASGGMSRTARITWRLRRAAIRREAADATVVASRGWL